MQVLVSHLACLCSCELVCVSDFFLSHCWLVSSLQYVLAYCFAVCHCYCSCMCLPFFAYSNYLSHFLELVFQSASEFLPVSTVLFSNWSLRYCSAVTGVMCYVPYVFAVSGDYSPCLHYSYHVWLLAMGMITSPSHCAMGQWSTIFSLNHYSRP